MPANLLSRFSLLAFSALVTLALGSPGAAAQGPMGGDAVILGRLYEKTATGTAIVGKFGLIASRNSDQRSSTSVVDDPSGGLACTVSWTAEIKGGIPLLRYEVRWTGRRSGGPGGDRGKQGNLRLEPGMLGHVTLLKTQSRELFASVESGRASSFGLDKLSRHFHLGIAPAPAPVRQAAPRPVAPPAPPAPRVAPQPDLRGVQAPAQVPRATGSAQLDLSFRLSQDGVPVFAPRALVREGERFHFSGGDRLELGGKEGSRSYDGFELAGSARRSSGGCSVDLNLQTGRLLQAGGPATWLVDRFRGELFVADGSELKLEVFGDLDGRGVGRIDLAMTCSVR